MDSLDCFFNNYGCVDAYGSRADCKPVPSGSVGSIPTTTTNLKMATDRLRVYLPARIRHWANESTIVNGSLLLSYTTYMIGITISVL